MAVVLASTSSPELLAQPETEAELTHSGSSICSSQFLTLACFFDFLSSSEKNLSISSISSTFDFLFFDLLEERCEEPSDSELALGWRCLPQASHLDWVMLLTRVQRGHDMVSDEDAAM